MVVTYGCLQLVLVIVNHAETKDTGFVNEVKNTIYGEAHKIPGGVNVIPIPMTEYCKLGYDRQQFNMFWADNFTNYEFIGFIDTDAAFVTYVDREDLWENGKPVINGRSGTVVISEFIDVMC
jgi:hypothetical protein